MMQPPYKSPHDDPAQYGQTFGAVTVTVCEAARDCVLNVTTPGLIEPGIRVVRFHSLDEIEGAYYAQRNLAAKKGPHAVVARNMASALRFAYMRLTANSRAEDAPERMPAEGGW